MTYQNVELRKTLIDLFSKHIAIYLSGTHYSEHVPCQSAQVC